MDTLRCALSRVNAEGNYALCVAGGRFIDCNKGAGTGKADYVGSCDEWEGAPADGNPAISET